MKIIACIPARYASVRFPGKVLAKETGRYLVQHTYEQACKAKLPFKVIIAADDEKIASAARQFGAECIMTGSQHNSGTDRIAEAVAGLEADIIVNVQADEPEIEPETIDCVAQLLVDNPSCPMATMAGPFDNVRRIADPNIVKVITDTTGRAIYFSRSPIPYDRSAGEDAHQGLSTDTGRGAAGIGPAENYLRHIGIYAYRKNFLLEFTALPAGRLEKIEKLEQLRAIEAGFPILVGRVKHIRPGIDTPEQYAEFVKKYKQQTSGI